MVCRYDAKFHLSIYHAYVKVMKADQFVAM